jgi:hypothetical protein
VAHPGPAFFPGSNDAAFCVRQGGLTIPLKSGDLFQNFADHVTARLNSGYNRNDGLLRSSDLEQGVVVNRLFTVDGR